MSEQLSFNFDRARERGRALGSGMRASSGSNVGGFGSDIDAGGESGFIDFTGGIGGEAYEGASNANPDLASWRPFNYSGQSSLTFARDRLAARIHQLARDDGWASSAISKRIDAVIGAGMRLHATPNARRLGITEDQNEELIADIEAAWHDYAMDFESCDAGQRLPFGMQQALAYRHWLTDGETISLSLWLERGTEWSTAVQMIDPDRLSNPWLRLDSVNQKHGVDLGPRGEPLGYWFREAHPGDLGVIGAYPWRWNRVARKYPNGRWQCVHAFVPKRAGQVTGEPPLAPILRKIQMIRKYDTAELQAAVLNALMALFVKSPNDPEQVARSFEGGDELTPWQASRLGYYEHLGLKIPNVTLKFLFPSDEVVPVKPEHPNANFEAFLKSALRNIATAAGVTYEQLTGDYSETNYASARAAILEVWRGFTSDRLNFATIFAQPHYQNWLEEALETGRVKYPNGAPRFREARMAYSRAKWLGPGRGLIDPAKESQGSAMRLSIGTGTFADECAEQGGDWREIFAQRARERREMERLQLPLDQVVAPMPKGIKSNEGDSAEPAERREAAA